MIIEFPHVSTSDPDGRTVKKTLEENNTFLYSSVNDNILHIAVQLQEKLPNRD
jgi:hypothetical protein